MRTFNHPRHSERTPALVTVRLLQEYASSLPIDFVSQQLGLRRAELDEVLVSLSERKVVHINVREDSVTLAPQDAERA